MLTLTVEVASRGGRHRRSPFISPTLPTKLPGQKKKWQTQLFLCHSCPRTQLKNWKGLHVPGTVSGWVRATHVSAPSLGLGREHCQTRQWAFGCCGWEVARCPCLALPFTLGVPHVISRLWVIALALKKWLGIYRICPRIDLLNVYNNSPSISPLSIIGFFWNENRFQSTEFVYISLNISQLDENLVPEMYCLLRKSLLCYHNTISLFSKCDKYQSIIISHCQ